jgi:hypothetical protein
MADGFSAATKVLRQIPRFLEIKTSNCDSGSGSVSGFVKLGTDYVFPFKGSADSTLMIIFGRCLMSLIHLRGECLI